MCMTPSPETLDFIRLHRTDDVQALALHAARHPGIDFPFALKQIAGWQASRHKLPRWSATEGILYLSTCRWNNARRRRRPPAKPT